MFVVVTLSAFLLVVGPVSSRVNDTGPAGTYHFN